MAQALKDTINRDVVAAMAKHTLEVDQKADVAPLLAAADELEALELKDRVNLLADALAVSMSGTTKKKLKTVAKVAKLAAADRSDGLTEWPYASFIERHGLDEPEAALMAIEQVTETFTCEFAIRPFLTNHLDLTLESVHRWTASSSEHPRRLASEGTRPKLPWGPDVPSLLADPSLGLKVLEKLRHDESEYVRRSVANHLNDVAKTHPELVIETTARWNAETETDKSMIRHALRTLVKAGHPGAMKVLGFSAKPKLDVVDFSISPASITLGDSIELVATIKSEANADQRFVVDFVIHHVLANGSTSPKVFKWATPTISKDETLELRKKRKIATASTRRYYPGTHQIDLQVAGSVMASAHFELPRGS